MADDCLHCLILDEINHRTLQGALGDDLLNAILSAAADLIAAAPPEERDSIVVKVRDSIRPMVREAVAKRDAALVLVQAAGHG